MKISQFENILLVFAATIVFGCQDKIDLNLPEGEERLVVEGWITGEYPSHFVRLSYSAPYFSNSHPPAAEGATVILENDLGNEQILDETEPGVYEIAGQGEVGRKYRLRIHLPKGEAYLSKYELLRPPVPIDSIYYKLSKRPPIPQLDETPDQIYDVYIDTHEPAGRGDFYRWRSFRNGIEAQRPYDIVVISDYYVDGVPVKEFNVTDMLYAQGDTVEIVQERISAAAYEFLATLWSQTAQVGGPFDTPPVPIKSNIENLTNPDKPALGFFGAAGVSHAQIIVGEE